ncbi:MAG TPA: penicillin acylase family protein [Candidatus Binatia bacterium]|jgi:penicillin amidase
MDLPKRRLFSKVFSALHRSSIHVLDHPALPIHKGELHLNGVRRPVEVLWDQHAVPHVSAFDEQDLFFTQGYLHAQERLWQMDMNRRFLSGRMAEVFGNFPLPWRELSSQFRDRTSVDFDYFMRLIGIRAAAAASLDLLEEDDVLRLHSYCDGVNRYIENCGKHLPWEFRLLRYDPEPWRPEDTLTIGKGFAFLLSPALYTRLNFIAVAARLADEPAKLRSLFPSYPDDGPVSARAAWDAVRGVWQFCSGVLAESDWHPAGSGSNCWAIAPARSKNGAAILCNDPHLRLALPSAWYLTHLRAETNLPRANIYEAWGASIPGVPFIQVGHNRHVAWGITAALCDDAEIYREKVHRIEPDLYLAGEHWEKFQIRKERIAVRGKPAVEKMVRVTRHGPAISDFAELPSRGEVLTARWSAQEPSQELYSLYGINRAETWGEFLDSLRYHTAPSLNFIYADRGGNIGYALAGKIPRRRGVASLLPVSGWNEDNDWLGYIAFEELPHVYNPPEGTVANANNRITDRIYPYYFSQFFEPPHRVRRIEQLLNARSKFTFGRSAEIQFDCLSIHAIELIAELAGELSRISDQESTTKAAAQRLLAWDGRCDVGSVDAAIFHLFHYRLLQNLLTPTLGEELCCAYTEILNQCIVPTDRILADRNSIWFSRQSRYTLVLTALREACGELQEKLGNDIQAWQWGKIHQLHMTHAFGRKRVFKHPLGIGPLPTPGDGMTINLGFYRHSNPFTQTVGSSLRFVAELGESIRSEMVLPSGQSGHPSSLHYRDQTGLWIKNKRISLTNRSSQSRLLLKPVSANIVPIGARQ